MAPMRSSHDFIGWSGTRFICAGDLRKRIHRREIRRRKRDSDVGGIDARLGKRGHHGVSVERFWSLIKRHGNA